MRCGRVSGIKSIRINSLLIALLSDADGAELPEGEAEDHPPRREALQHPARQARKHEAVRFRHLRAARG